jgi:hypothetical protein
MKTFFIFEVIIQILILATAIFIICKNYDSEYKPTALSFFTRNQKQIKQKYLIKIIFYFYMFFFPSVQAAGLIFLKSSKDPLSNISKLKDLKLISINQRGSSLKAKLDDEKTTEWI